MSSVTLPENGGAKNGKTLMDKAEIEFPVTFQLKAVLDTTSTDEQNKEKLSHVFTNLKIKNNYVNSKTSSKGTYISYHYQVTLISKLQLETLYDNLKSVPGLKFAL